jgi:hypothetical protein
VADMPLKFIRPHQPPDYQQNIDRGYATLTAIIQYCSNQLLGGSDVGSVWRVEARNHEVKVRKLTTQETNGLATIGDAEGRMGIVPSSVIEELRQNET